MNQHPHPQRMGQQHAMNDRLGGRRLCARRSLDGPYVMWRGADASFVAFSLGDPFAAANSLADCLAECVDLVNLNGSPVWVKEGQLVPVTASILHELVPQYVATRELVNLGTEQNPNWVLEYLPFRPDPRLARDLFANERREGGLLPRLTRVTGPQTNEPRRQQKVFIPPA